MISMRLVFAVHLLFVLNIVCGHWLQLLNPLRLFHSDQKEEIQTNLVEARAAVVARGIQVCWCWEIFLNRFLRSTFPIESWQYMLHEFSIAKYVPCAVHSKECVAWRIFEAICWGNAPNSFPRFKQVQK